jgi:FMN-dependent NADH-azoreductase
MKTLLQVNTSIFGNEGQSTRLADEFVELLDADKVVVRDLARDPVPHLDAERFGAFLSKPETRTQSQTEVLAYSDGLINELKQADIIVLGLPMYNFGLPSNLKAYFDHIARAGVTFKYTDKGSVGLLTGKKAYVFATRGGIYVGKTRDGQTQDTQSTYIRDFLAFLGITDVEFVYAEGLAMGDASKTASLAKARESLNNLVPAFA